VVVIDEHDPTWPNQPPEVDEVHEDPVETMVAVDEGQIEGTALPQ
jgi:hypothetical protein